MIKRIAVLALIGVASVVALVAIWQWRAAGPTPTKHEVMSEFAAALPAGSEEHAIIAYLDLRGFKASIRVTDAGEVIVLDYGVPAAVRVVEARIQQHDSRPIVLGTSELIVSFVMTADHRLDRTVIWQFITGL